MLDRKLRFMALSASLAAALLVGGADPSFSKKAKITRQIPVDQNFVDGELTWSVTHGGYFYKWRGIVVNGVLEVCGVGVYTNLQNRPNSKALMRKAYILLNNKKIMRDMRYFSVVKRKSQLASAQANCRSTGIKAPKRWEIFLRWDSGTYRY